MRIVDLLKVSLKSFAPSNYRKLTAHHSQSIIQTYMVSVLTIMLLMLLISIPQIAMLPEKFSQTAEEFDQFSISLNVSAPKAIELMSNPKVVVDLERENRSDEFVLLNNKGMNYQEYLWFGERFVSWKSVQSVSENASLYSSWLTIISVLLIPSLLVTIFLLILLESAIIGSITWLLATIILKLSKFHIHNKQLSKIITLALIPFLTVQIIPLAYIRWFIIPIILFFILVSTCIWLVGENRFEHKVSKL